MGSLTPEIRECIVKAYRQGYRVKDIAGIFGVSRYIRRENSWRRVNTTRIRQDNLNSRGNCPR